MAFLWVICGAGRGVGKTFLSENLCQVLPEAVYAKQGCSEPKDGKQKNYFRTLKELKGFITKQRGSCSHLVVESNTLAKDGMGDLVVYLGPLPAHTDIRDDAEQLRKNAHIGIDSNAVRSAWQAVLADKLASPDLCEGIDRIFVTLLGRYREIGLAVRSKLWFLKNEERIFGPGLARLLEGVKEHGTLRAAVDHTKISYRHAWDVIKGAEKHLGKKLTTPQVGGRGGGGSTLSEAGEELLNIFHQINIEVARFADAKFAEKWAQSPFFTENGSERKQG